jgi:Flp pilus assembly protein TadB
MPKQQIMRILGAAIVLIVLSFAPSVARAHIGHQHQASVHDEQGQATSQLASHGSEWSATSASLQQAQWNQTETPPASDRNCTGDCCLSACAACCAAGLPSPVAFLPFLRSITRVAFAPSQIWPNREPESLRRPPKHFI